MRIATWNVNGLRARLEFFKHWLEQRRPDVVCLQELKLTEEQFPFAELEGLGYHAAVHGQKAWNGVAVLSREPSRIVQLGLPGQEEFGARLITVDVAGISVTSLYCPNGKSVGHADYPRKLAWFEALRDNLGEHYAPDDDAVIGGDFNICPEGLDSWDEPRLRGSIFHTDEERARLEALLDWGLVDLFRRRFPQQRAYSWWDYRGGAFHRKQGLRIDFLLATAAAEARVREVTIDRDWRKKQHDLTPSDHAPVVADLA